MQVFFLHIPLGLPVLSRSRVSDTDLCVETAHKWREKQFFQLEAFNWKIGWSIKMNLQHIMLPQRIKHSGFSQRSHFYFLLLCFSLKCETWRQFEKVYSDPSNLTDVQDHRKADHETRPDLPSEQTKHQLTLMCSWFLQPLRGVKWFGQRKLLFASTKLPAAIQLSLA